MKQNIIAVDFDGTLCENKWPEIGMISASGSRHCHIAS